MTTVFILVLLGAVRWSTSHVIYSKDPARITRLPFEDWRPIREAGHRYMQSPYPSYHKGYNYSPSKKIQQTEQSEHVEVFSPAPPTILGSFSVFGHATVNAREHASHITKKSPRPQIEYPQYDRPKNGYQLRHQYVSPYYEQKRPQNGDQAYYFDASLRPPPREINNKISYYSPHAQSTSLTPNTFYFEQPQPFQPSGVDNSYHKARKPKPTHTPYRATSPVDFRTDFEPSLSYYSNFKDYHRNPFGDIHLNRRPENVKPVTEEKEYRPFQNTHYTTTTQKDIQTFQPYVTTFPSEHVKFSEVAQPFQVNEYQTQGIKPDYIVTQQPFTQEVYPITVTTIDVPVEPFEPAKKVAEPKARPRPAGFEFPNHKPNVQVSSYQGYKNIPTPFLPTPSPDIYIEEQSTQMPDHDVISTIDNKYQENTELATDAPTTIMVETTTKRPSKRRRPSRPSTRNDLSSNLKNHRLEEVSSTTADYFKHQRRRKPSKYREGSEYKRRTTTTTEVYEPTEQNDITTIADISHVQNDDLTKDFNPFELSDVQIPENEPAEYDDYRHSTTSTTTTTTTTTQAPTTEAVTTSTSRLKNKYGNNRPRFSVKDYRERLNKATSTSPPEVEKPKVKNESNRYTGRIRTRPTEPTSEPESTTESKFKKYKTRVGPSRYKTSTQQTEDVETTTTERTNTFRPSTNRYKPGTGKYYSRYRTSTIAPKEADDSPVPTAKVTIKPKGVFSAKRRPLMKPKLSIKNEESEEKFGEKMNENEVVPDVITKKMDSITTTMSNNEISSTKASLADVSADTTGEEAMRVADLTSSSSNDYHTPSILRTNRRPPKITLPTDEPILPLEAFFQTHNKE